ncbi:DUF6049 family protein [Saccharopolyspora rectivirgula]|uniref:DUF6049 family protein n=1 Tax=Saccharopolyspora rectivirgula TaxID=28042 RepID=UPI00240A2E64|nr:DUF6049 family protein [Saccharopolyspora rectivirgula]
MRALLAVLAAALLATLVALPAPPARAQDGTRIELDVTNVTPGVVQGNSPPEVVITGVLTNTTGQTITGLEGRVQRGNPVTTEPDTQRAMRGNTPIVTTPYFRPIADRLAPGQQLPVELRIPLAGPNSLQITEPGIYPLLVNVNGAPEGGSRARIAEEQFLLPVLAPPGGAPAKPSKPTPFSMLVPIADYPHLELEALPGSRAVLTDDELSASIAPGGRLYELVQGVADNVGSGSPMGNAICFAIDPDLLITVRAMRDGYLVRQPDGSTVEGIGSDAAELWLNKLRDATKGRCVISLPYADADVVALQHAGLPDLVQGAMDGTALVRDILGVEPRPALWPAEGALDDDTAASLPENIDTVLVDPASTSHPAGSLQPARVRGQDLTAVPLDPLLTAAADPLHATAGEVAELSPPNSGSAATQNVLGALAFRAGLGQLPDSPSVLAPPRRWNVSGEELRALFDGVRQLVDAGYLAPTSLPAADPAGPAEVELTYPASAEASEVVKPVLKELAAQNFKVGDLYRSSRRDRATNVDPGRVTTPMRNGLLHAASSAWRGAPDGARRWIRIGTTAVEGVLNRVRVEEFSGQITLTANNSPIPLTVVNDLPITVRLVLDVSRVPGVEIDEFGGDLLSIPPNSKRQFWLTTTVHRAGKFNIDVTARTEAGTQFGTMRRLQVQSSAYGQLIPVLTGVAGGLLVVLSAARIYRARRKRNSASADAPPAEPVEAAEATSAPTAESDRKSG